MADGAGDFHPERRGEERMPWACTHHHPVFAVYLFAARLRLTHCSCVNEHIGTLQALLSSFSPLNHLVPEDTETPGTEHCLSGQSCQAVGLAARVAWLSLILD